MLLCKYVQRESVALERKMASSSSVTRVVGLGRDEAEGERSGLTLAGVLPPGDGTQSQLRWELNLYPKGLL